MNKMNTGSLLPPSLPLEVIEQAKRLGTTLLSDAMGCTGAMDYTIKPVLPNMYFAGTAMTVNMRPADNLFLHKAISIGQKGYVIVADGKGHTRNAYLGELMAGAAQAAGLEGIVIDGMVRDKDSLCELKIPIFAKGFVSNGPFKDGPGELNTTISCGGVTVSPGDLVIGDSDGVVVIPKHLINEVLEKAEKKLIYEEKRKEEIKRGKIKPSWLQEKMEPFGL